MPLTPCFRRWSRRKACDHFLPNEFVFGFEECAWQQRNVELSLELTYARFSLLEAKRDTLSAIA
jgi:hypothetical protein